jgi:hypothetical protein
VASPDYHRLALDLPEVYQEDEDSFAQIDSYLGLADELARAYLEGLDGLATWLSPHAVEQWPPGLLLDAGREAVRDAYLAVFDELALWFAFAFPGSWTRNGAGIAKRREFLAKAARLWRRRGTPRGFLDWFCLAFDVPAARRPWLVEHFKFGAPESASGETGPAPWLRATLFVPSIRRFADFSRRREAIQFARHYAPAHVKLRVCWVTPDFTLEPVPGPGAPTAEVAAYRTRIRRLLCSLVSFVDHANGVRIWECIDEGRPIDRLGVGRLPGGGQVPDS